MKFVILDFGSAIAEAKRLELGANAANTTLPVMEKIAVNMMEVERELFKSQGRRGGGSWKQLKDETIRKKGTSEILYTAGAKPKYKPLWELGDNLLHDSLTHPDAKFQSLLVFKHTIHFGTKRPYAAVHQFGRGRVPRRPFLKFEPYDISRWTGYIERHFMAPHITG